MENNTQGKWRVRENRFRKSIQSEHEYLLEDTISGKIVFGAVKILEEICATLNRAEELERENIKLWKSRKEFWDLLLDSKCRDCADSLGTCPHDKEPCDPQERAIKRLTAAREEIHKLKDALEVIDDLLSEVEDFTHGKAGEDITRMRHYINTLIKNKKGT